ncbi:ankyrin repeat domain-containing protein [Candidatus Babeliales bacterium]|nr:ankyrin repeat domain-containing protein [Candidatus Babeliales bacterium]
MKLQTIIFTFLLALLSLSTLDASASPSFDDTKSQLLLAAADNCCAPSVEKLLKEEVDPNTQNDWGWTPLHFAARNECTETVNILIKYGADLNMKNEDGITPLHLATLSQQNEVVKTLLKNGANLNMLDNDRKTPLNHAVERGNAEIATILEEAAIVNIKPAKR